MTAKIDFLKDDVKDMTFGRRLALKLHDNRCYNPSGAKGDDETQEASVEAGVGPKIDDFEEHVELKKPSLKEGWAYFEHHTLYRYLVGEKGSYDLASPGEKTHPTRLYHWFWTPHSQLGDFGHGVGLYFSTLRYLIFVTLGAGLISLANIIYFSSEEYKGVVPDSFLGLIRSGSAMCSIENGVNFVPCPDCVCKNTEDYDSRLSPFPGTLKYAQCAFANSTDGTELTFAAKTECDGTKWQVIATNFASMIFVAITLLGLGWYLKRQQKVFDEDEQTARDYSIQIKNPPEDAKDPEEWRSFFQKNFGAHASVCTCAIPNDELLKVLVARRELLRKIGEIRPGESLKTEDIARDVTAEGKKSKLSKLYEKLLDQDSKAKELSEREYPVTSVFVTFETEEGQREVLKSLLAQKNASENYLFRGEHKLDVQEPEQPDTIRWLDLNTGFLSRLARRLVTSTFVVVLLVFGLLTIIAMHMGKVPSSYLGLVMSFYMFYFPGIANAVLEAVESHQTETSKQSSVYFNNVMIVFATGPIFMFAAARFESTILGDMQGVNGLIPLVSMVLFLNIVITSFFDAADLGGIFSRHIFAPRAKTQDSMNYWFKGEEWCLTHYYQSMMSMMFMCTFFSAIFPTGYFFVAIGMTLQYIISKRTLLRTCHRTLSLGTSHAKINRRFFFPFIIGFSAMMCSLFWSGFPFDNLCERNEDYEYDSAYVGTFNLTANVVLVDSSLQTFEFEFTSSDKQYRVCNQNFVLPDSTYPYVPSLAWGSLKPEDYMSEDQLMSTEYFGWSALVIFLICLLRALFGLYETVRPMIFGKSLRAKSASRGIPFSSLKSKRAYIPEMNSEAFPYPLIGCTTDGINEELFAFEDLDRTYKYYDLSVDMTKILKTDAPPACFSTVKSWESVSKNESSEA